ncbi:APC family permease [Paenibacillus sp. CAU 1782]
MFAALLGCLPAVAAGALILALGWKAQGGIESSRYQSMSMYGLDAQLLQDKSDLHRLGLAQILSRRWRGIPALGLSFNTMAMIGSAAMLFGPALIAGGPTVVGIGFPLLALLSLPVAAALAELMSAVPSSGGIYHVAYLFGGRRWAICTGWLHAIGQVAMLALLIGGCAVFASMLLAARLGYEQSPLTLGLAAAAVACSLAAANLWGHKARQSLAAAGVWLQLLLAAAILGGLAWFFWPGDYSPAALYAFRDIGWSGAAGPEGLLLGTLLLLKLFTGMEGAAQGAEETIEPRVRVPWSIYMSVAFVFAFGFVLLMFMTLVLPSSLASGSNLALAPWMSGFAGGEWFLQSAMAGWGGTAAIAIMIVLSLWLSGVQAAGICARTLFAMARDEALPCSRRLATVSVSRQLPITAICYAAVLPLALLAACAAAGLNNLFLLLLSLGLTGFQLAYAVPIGLRLKSLFGNRRKAELAASHGEGPWHLGSWSKPIHTTAFAWLAASGILSALFIHPGGGAAIAVLLALAALRETIVRKRRTRIGEGRDTMRKANRELAVLEGNYPLN